MAILGSVVATMGSSASAAGTVSITVTATPSPVATGQSLAYTISVANTGGSTATSNTITDTLNGVAGANAGNPAMTTNLGTCSYTAPTVTCTAPSLAAGQVWTATVTGQVTAASATTLSDSATVSGTYSSGSFSQSASVTTPVSPTVQPGFAQTKLAGGLSKPIALAFAPNGDTYIAEQSGTIVIYRNGAILPNPLVTLTNVYCCFEDGLLGMALDPNFATNGYIYLSYVVNVTNAAGVTQPFSQLSRFTVVNNSINLSTEKVLMRGNQAQNQHHPGNTVKIGPDGKLWWAVGDNVPAITNAETLTNIYGKMLRLNLDGSIPADNPFVNVPNAVPAIYAYGLRNPFRFNFLPNGNAITEDTGSSYWEELDTIQRGGNYGWDFDEGNCFSCGYINPTFAYGHYEQDGAGSAITAYAGNAFPRPYNRAVFVGDYVRQDIEAITFDATYQTETSQTVLSSNAGSIADLEEGPDGNLYFVSIFQGTFSEISAVGPFQPTAVISATPNAGAGPLNVQLDSTGSSDPYDRSLTYSWNFGDGSAGSTLPHPAHTYASNGTYTVTLTVNNGSTTGSATTTVVVGHDPPTASISAPSTYNAGDTVNYSGTATDPTDGALPGYDYSWQVDFFRNGAVQPSYFADVAHPFYGPVDGSAGSFQIPTDPSQTPGSFYRITLTVTDSIGIRTVVTKDLHPNLTSWMTNTNVPGTGYSVDGTWQTGSYNTTDVVGVQHVLMGMPLVQIVGGTRYRFQGFADGSALSDSFTSAVTAAPATYTANYVPDQTALPTGWQSTDVGPPLMPGQADYSAGDQTFYIDGTGADTYGANDQFHYVYQTLNGDGTIVARVRYQSNSSPWAKAGVMIKQSATAGAPFVNALVSPDVSPNTPNDNGVGCDADGCFSPLPPITPAMGHGARMQYSGSHSATPPSYPAGFASPNKWVKLTKTGNDFTSYLSSDGVHFTQMGVATVAMTGPVTIGLFDTSHNIGQFSTAAFDHVQITGAQPPPPPNPLPGPWTDTDIGSPALAGSADYTNGAFTLNGAGADIWGTNDQFHYAYQPASTSGTIVARVTSQTNTSSNAKAGVMFKQSTTAGSNYIMISTNPAGGIKVQYNFNASVGGVTYAFPNVWMKLVWSAGKFSAYTSGDGVTWTAVLTGKTIAMNSPATVGLFECSHNTSALGTATFDNVSYTSP